MFTGTAAVKKLAGKSNPEWQPISAREQELRRQKIKRELEESELARREPEMALTGCKPFNIG